jgi:hypothetical protein
MNTNTQEWGNIELPGLSDEELFKKNWIKVEIGRETAQRNLQNPNWHKNQRAADEKRKEFGNSNEWKEYTRQLNQREEWKHNNKIANQHRNLNPENVIAFQQGMEKRSKNEDWKKNVKNASQNRDDSWLENLRKTKALEGTPIVTPEGFFLKFTDGVKHYMPIWNLKKGGADYRLRKLLNDENNKQFIRISLEEYITLTGKDPFN